MRKHALASPPTKRFPGVFRRGDVPPTNLGRNKHASFGRAQKEKGTLRMREEVAEGKSIDMNRQSKPNTRARDCEPRKKLESSRTVAIAKAKTNSSRSTHNHNASKRVNRKSSLKGNSKGTSAPKKDPCSSDKNDGFSQLGHEKTNNLRKQSTRQPNSDETNVRSISRTHEMAESAPEHRCETDGMRHDRPRYNFECICGNATTVGHNSAVTTNPNAAPPGTNMSLSYQSQNICVNPIPSPLVNSTLQNHSSDLPVLPESKASGVLFRQVRLASSTAKECVGASVTLARFEMPSPSRPCRECAIFSALPTGVRPFVLLEDNHHSSNEDDDAVIAAIIEEEECSVEVSLSPEDLSTMVSLLSKDKYDTRMNESEASGSYEAPPVDLSGKLCAELHHKRISGEEVGGGGGGAKGISVSLKTVRFATDSANEAWDLNFFPTDHQRDAETKGNDAGSKNLEKEEKRLQRLALWKASAEHLLEDFQLEKYRPLPPKHREERNFEVSNRALPSSADLSIESSMGSSFTSSEGVASTIESSITCSLRSVNSRHLTRHIGIRRIT